MTKSLEEHAIAAQAILMRLPAEGFALIRPRDEDYVRAFRPDQAVHARASYEGLWANPPPWPGRPDQTEWHVTAALAEDFLNNDSRAAPFPGGYREVASTFQPGSIWLLWEVVRPGEPNGITFDGLVAIDDRYAWFPKPWRVGPSAG
jgi:hypothetical protein